MTNEDEPPGWLPDPLKRYWTEGELRPPRHAQSDLGKVPGGTDLRVRAPAGDISLVANVGPDSRLHLIGDMRFQVAVDGFSVIRLKETLPRSLVLSADANIHLETGGTLALATASTEEPTARVWFADESGSAGACTLTTSVAVKSISGKSSAAVELRGQGNVAGRPLAAGAAVDLPNCPSLTVHGQLEGSEVELSGRLLVIGGLAGSCQVTAGAVLVGPNTGPNRWSPTDDVMAEPGTTVRARKGELVISGRVQGTEQRPVVLTGAKEKEVKIGPAECTTVQPADGQQLGAVTIGPTSHVAIRSATSISDHGADAQAHLAPAMEASTRIALSGLVRGGRLQAQTVRVRDVVGPAVLVGGSVGLGNSAHEDAGTVSIEATDWIMATSAADLHVTARGDGPCRLLLSQRHGNTSVQNAALDPPPEDLLEDGVSDLARENNQTATLELHGPLQVECSAATTVVRRAERVISVRAAGDLLMPAGGAVGQVRSAGELHLGADEAGEAVLVASDVMAPVIQSSEETPGRVTLAADGRVYAGSVQLDELSCVRLRVDRDASLAALRVTEATHISGRLSAPEGSGRSGEYRLSGKVELADVDVALILDKAHGSIKASDRDEAEEGEGRTSPVIAELQWQEPTGSLHLDHEVSILQVRSTDQQTILEVPIPSACERIEIEGDLLIRSGGGARPSDKPARSNSAGESAELPRVLLAGGSNLTMALGHPVWIDLDDSAEAEVRVQDGHVGVVHLVEEATRGRLALSVPRKSSQDYQTARLQSSATGAEVPSQPTIVIEQGDLMLIGAFADVLALDATSGQDPSGAAPTTVHLLPETVIHRMRGVVALGMFHGRVTGAEADHGPLHRFTASGVRRGWRAALQKVLGGLVADASDDDRLVLVDPAPPGGDHRAISAGVLVGADVTRLSFAELDRLKGLDVFSPDPVALERKARARLDSAAARQSNAQHLSHIAQLVQGRPVTGSVRSMANWAASTAHAATGRGLERAGRRAARMLGYGQRPLPALALLVGLVALTTAVLSMTGVEAAICDSWFSDTNGAEAVAGYTWVQHLERVLLAPLAFLRVAGQNNGLQPLGCNPLLQVVGTVLVALPLAFVLIGLRNYLRSPVDRKP